MNYLSMLKEKKHVIYEYQECILSNFVNDISLTEIANIILNREILGISINIFDLVYY